MSLYSVVHKERKLINSDSPCSIEQAPTMNYEDTESEYASELRRQTYLQKIGKKIVNPILDFRYSGLSIHIPFFSSFPLPILEML